MALARLTAARLGEVGAAEELERLRYENRDLKLKTGSALSADDDAALFERAHCLV